MSESTKTTFRNRPPYRRRTEEPQVVVSGAQYSVGATVPVKHLGYLHAHCGLAVSDIIGRYPNRLTLASVHRGLSEYYANQKAFDAALKAEARFNVSDALKDSSMRLPQVGLASLVQVEEMFQTYCEAERLKANREREANRLLIKPHI